MLGKLSFCIPDIPIWEWSSQVADGVAGRAAWKNPPSQRIYADAHTEHPQ